MVLPDKRVAVILCLVLPSMIVAHGPFTAAVFEHRPRASNNSGLPPKQMISENLQFYIKAAEVAKNQGADIIVFNEYGLFPYPGSRENFQNFAENIPDPRQHKFNPCTANAKERHILYTLSCTARHNGIYLVANMADVHQCEGTCETIECGNTCPEDGHFFYNTDVVFDREGNLIARYHKMHPYFEHVNIPDQPEMITFDTSFGKFGLIICFDSVFSESLHLVKEEKIDTLIFPTYWFDDILPLNTVEWQQAWALANGVNFLAANTQTPGSGSLGSGIYSKDDGALVYTYEPDGQSKLLIANIPPMPRRSDIIVITPNDPVFHKVETGDKFPDQGYEKIVGKATDMYSDYRYVTSQTENYTKTKLNQPSGEIKACNNGFCCSLSYTTEGIQDDFYLVAFSGKNNVRGYFHWWEENCFLIRCDSLEGEPCVVQPPTSHTVFRNANLSARFSEGVIYPTVTKKHFRLAPRKEFHHETKDSRTKLTFTATSDEPLLKMGLLGRIYDQDPPYIPFHQF